MNDVKPFSSSDRLTLSSQALGGLPLVNHFLDRLNIDGILQRYVPHTDHRFLLPPSRTLGLFVRNILLSRTPLYSLSDWASSFVPEVLGLSSHEMGLLNDDRVGRSLDYLFDADRASMVTEIVVQAIREFEIDLNELHNDSTTVTLSGQYANANGSPRRGRSTIKITYGHNKEHRPDLKQILWILTVSADGAVPVHFRTGNGNLTDDQTHIQTWETLRKLIGRADFLYVADSKLCVHEALSHIDVQGGHFLTILPKTRREEGWFREWVQTHAPDWKEVRRGPHPRRQDGPSEIYRVTESPLPSSEGYRIIWVYSSLKAEQDLATRQGKIEKGILALEMLETRLRGVRSRFQNRAAVAKVIETDLAATGAALWLNVTIEETVEDRFRQEKKGRPGVSTRYRRAQKPRFHLQWEPCSETIDFDAKTDGMFPLITNERKLSAGVLLQKYKYQPRLEKRHEQLKTVYDVMPVLLKSVTRIEGLLTVYFLALLVEALIEREIRRKMQQFNIRSLPLYPEERLCRAPTTDRVMELLSDLRKNVLFDGSRRVQTFPPELSELQQQVLGLLDIPLSAYTSCH